MAKKLHKLGEKTLGEEINDTNGELKSTDLFYGGAENGGVVTLYTIDRLLYNEWFEAYADDLYEKKQEFDLENVTSPGVHRDDEIYRDGDEQCYTIVLPYDFITIEMVEDYIEQLNKEYGENLELEKNKRVTVELENKNGGEVELK